MLLKKIVYTHLIPISIALIVVLFMFGKFKKQHVELNFKTNAIQQISYVDRFYPNQIESQFAFSYALKNRIPVVLGSSELTSEHLEALPKNFFKTQRSFSLGHAGFQSFAILACLAANRTLLQQSKITIILSPGWFEKQYSSGTSLNSFFEFCPPNYLYQIYKDELLDFQTKAHIQKFMSVNYDKISSPNAVIRLMGRKTMSEVTNIMNWPYDFFDKKEIQFMEQVDFNLISQRTILNSLTLPSSDRYHFYNRPIKWDSLTDVSKAKFKTISNNNDLSVENNYYSAWLKNKPKKKLEFVDEDNNQELQDFYALVRFLKHNHCKAQFVIMPLNTKAHENLNVLVPTINSINKALGDANFNILDLFTPNVTSYEEGILEDIMHPYNVGWYKIDKFILDNFNDDK